MRNVYLNEGLFYFYFNFFLLDPLKQIVFKMAFM